MYRIYMLIPELVEFPEKIFKVIFFFLKWEDPQVEPIILYVE